MQKAKILNSKEIKKIMKELVHYGFNGKLDYVFLKNNDNKLFILSKKFGDIDISRVRINNLGLYFGKDEGFGIRLSIEGSQLIKPTKNVLELDDEQVMKWMQGIDIEIKTELEGLVAIKNGNDFYGAGVAKNGKLLNFVPKSRRLTSKNIL